LYELLLLKQSLLLQVLCTHKSLREVERSANLLPGEAPLRALPCAASSDVSMDCSTPFALHALLDRLLFLSDVVLRHSADVLRNV